MLSVSCQWTFKKLFKIAIVFQAYEIDHCINSNCLYIYIHQLGVFKKSDPLTHILKDGSRFLKNNIIRVEYPTRRKRVGSRDTKFIESGTHWTVMYYLHQVEIYTLKFYNQYNYKKLIIVVCFSFLSKYTTPLRGCLVKEWVEDF